MKKYVLLVIAVVLFCSASAEPATYPRSIVIFDGFWLGSVFEGKWKSADDFKEDMAEPERRNWTSAKWDAEYPFPYPWGGQQYAIYLSTGYYCAAQGEGLQRNFSQESEDDWDKIEMRAGDERKDAALRKTAYLGLSGLDFDEENVNNRNTPFPRKVTSLSVKNSVYEKIMKEYLARNGLPDANVNIMQLFRVDLEGDGVDEVVIYAQNIVDPKMYADLLKQDKSMEEFKPELNPMPKQGMYSVLLLRKIVSGKVMEIPLASFIAPRGAATGDGSIPIVQRVYQFADLNGDGTMEIIFGGAYYEGYGYNVVEVHKNGVFDIVLSNGAGR